MFYGACTKRPNLCLLMELCDNGDVMTYFGRLRSPECTLPRFMYSDARRIATDVARALLYLHQCCRVVHRDVKLRNVLLTTSLSAKVSHHTVLPVSLF
jgi:serine/threonine protein kinase